MKTPDIISLTKKAITAANALRGTMLELCSAIEASPASHAHSAELYGVISELRETLRPATMRLAQDQSSLYNAGRGLKILGRELNEAHRAGTERARLAP
jgi:hypothetical protein